MAELSGIFVVVAVIGLTGVFSVWRVSRAKQIVRQWAAGEKLELLSVEYRYISRGPFFWTTSKGQSIVFVKTRDELNGIRSAYVLCGGFWGGVLQNKTRAKWEN